MIRFIQQLLLAIDQFANIFFFSYEDYKSDGYGFGYADETISARTYRLRKTSWFWSTLRTLLDITFFWDKGKHTHNAYLHEFKKHNLPPHYANKVKEGFNPYDTQD